MNGQDATGDPLRELALAIKAQALKNGGRLTDADLIEAEC